MPSGLVHLASTVTEISTVVGKFTSHIKLNGTPTNITSSCLVLVTEVGSGTMEHIIIIKQIVLTKEQFK